MASITITVTDENMPEYYGSYVINDGDSSLVGRITPVSRDHAVDILKAALGLDEESPKSPTVGHPKPFESYSDPTDTDEDSNLDSHLHTCGGDSHLEEEDDPWSDEDPDDYPDDEDYGEDGDYDDYEDDDFYVPERPHVFLSLSALKRGLLEDPDRPYKNHDVVFYYTGANNESRALQVRLDDGEDNDEYRFNVVASSGVKRPIMFNDLVPFEGVPFRNQEDPVVMKFYFNDEDLSKYDVEETEPEEEVVGWATEVHVHGHWVDVPLFD